MKAQSKTVATVVAVLLSLALPLSATASPGMVIVPEEYHFGEVELHTPVTVDIQLTNDWFDTIEIRDIFMVENSSPDFTFALSPDYNGQIPPFGTIVIKVIYTPAAPGFAAAVLAIDWLNGGQEISYVELDGTGIQAPGSVTIQDILDAFYNGVDDGTIVGVGRNCASRNAHLKVFEFKLLMVQFFVEKEWYQGACELLWHAYARSDSLLQPKDWIEDGEDGDGAVLALNNMILQLLSDMGCM